MGVFQIILRSNIVYLLVYLVAIRSSVPGVLKF